MTIQQLGERAFNLAVGTVALVYVAAAIGLVGAGLVYLSYSAVVGVTDLIITTDEERAEEARALAESQLRLEEQKEQRLLAEKQYEVCASEIRTEKLVAQRFERATERLPMSHLFLDDATTPEEFELAADQLRAYRQAQAAKENCFDSVESAWRHPST